MGCLSYDIQCMDLSIHIGQGVQDNKRSTSWICFSLSFAMISWASRKQKSVALSTAEVEYIAACDACTMTTARPHC
jgi:hypothetical protein